uniref:VQ domain-containing protein n=1 Tax=Cannabis sativa TaxID=3483 RepID=A0A803QIP7_CANSA
MSETMHNPPEWMQFYNPNFSGGSSSQGPTTTTNLFPDNRVSDSTVVVTTAAASTDLVGSGSSSPTAAAAAAAGANRFSPEGGRVSKPVRRRSRASRRTPTTLLNTDTTNFRAMVQQFTGGPTAPFANSGAHPGGPGFVFGLGGGGTRQNFVNPSAGMQYPFSLSTGAGDDGFVQRLNSGSRPMMGHTNNMGVSTEDFLMAGVSGSQVAGAGPPRPSLNSGNENRSNNFMF